MEEKDKDIVEKQDLIVETSSNTHEEKKKKSKNKSILFTILKKHKIGIAIIVLMLTVSSTLAWFTYSSAVDFSLSAHIKAWSVGFDAAYDDVYEFSLTDLYPGMPDAGDSVNIKNSGEVASSIDIGVNSFTLFGEVQEYGVDYILEKSADGKEYIIRGYPFELKFVLSNTQIEANPNAKQSLSYVLTWDYDNTNSESCTIDENRQVVCSPCEIVGDVNSCDLEDTIIGEASAEFRNNPNNVGLDSLDMSLSLTFTQIN